MQDLLKENRTYPALIEALRANADYVKEHLGTIASWLKSEEFQAKYKNKNHPPPFCLLKIPIIRIYLVSLPLSSIYPCQEIMISSCFLTPLVLLNRCIFF